MDKKTDIAIIRIRQFIRENGLSNLRFAKMAGMTEISIRRLFMDGFNPTLSTLRKMEAVIPKGYKATKLSAE